MADDRLTAEPEGAAEMLVIAIAAAFGAQPYCFRPYKEEHFITSLPGFVPKGLLGCWIVYSPKLKAKPWIKKNE